MDQALKERIVGAVVIVGLAVLLIPLVLDGPAPLPTAPAAPAADVPAVAEEADGSKTYRYDLDAPPADVDAATTAPLASAPTPAELAARPPVGAAPASASAAPPPAVAPAPAPTAPKPASTATAARDATATGKPSAPAGSAAPLVRGDTAWAAQAGTFGKATSARDLAARLTALGFKAFVTEYRDGNRTLYRVRVGPVKSRAEAEALAKRVATQAKLEARPVPHP